MSWLSSLKSVFSPAQEVKEEDIQAILQAYRLTGHSFELKDRITQVNVQGRVLQLTIKTYPEEADHLQQIHDELAGALQGAGIEELNLHVIQQKTAPRTQEVAATLPPVVDASASPTPDPNNPPIQKKAPLQSEVAAHPRIQHVILVSSGKGGVGKSTTTVNLALALHKQGLKVGVLDADIYGPSIPTMLGNAGQTPMIENESFVPLEAHGLAVLSIGHLTGDHNTPVAWPKSYRCADAALQPDALARFGCAGDRYATGHRRYSTDACTAHSGFGCCDCNHSSKCRIA